jgi:hypothetical protein
MYNALNDRARNQDLDSGGKARIFAGSYGEVWEATGISRTYYSSVRKALERHDAIQILQRGGRSADTVIVLKDLPTEWNIEGWLDGAERRLTNAQDYAILDARVEKLEKLLGGLDVTAALLEFEKRVVKLETKNNKKEK